MKRRLNFIVSLIMALVLSCSVLPIGAYAEAMPTVSEVTPAAGSTNVSVVSDISVKYSEVLSEDVLSTASVSVSQGVDSLSENTDYTVSVSGDTLTIKFPEELAYGTEYTATVSGISEEMTVISFVTEEDKTGYLVKLDFDDASDIEKLIPYGNCATDKITLAVTEEGYLDVTNRSKAALKYTFEGAEDWQDYSMYIKAKRKGSTFGEYGTDLFLYAKGYKAGFNVGSGNTGVQWMGSGSDVSGNKATAAWLSNFISIDEHSDGTRTVKKVLRNEDTQVDLVTEETDETGEITDNASYFYSSSYYVNAGKEPDMYIDCVYAQDLRAYPIAKSTRKNLAVGDTVSFEFSKAMATSTLTAENVVFSDGVTEVNAASVQCTDGINVSVTVPSGLSENDYTLIFKKEITDADGERLNNDKEFGITMAAADFYATEITPANGAVKVSVNPTISVTFNKNVDLDASNIIASLMDSQGDVKQLTVDTTNSSGNKVYFSCTGLLSYSETYTFALEGVASTDGSLMPGQFISTFTTEAANNDYLVKLDFDDASDIEKLIPYGNCATDKITLAVTEEGYLDVTNRSKAALKYTFEGAEDWQDYSMYIKAKRKGSTFGEYGTNLFLYAKGYKAGFNVGEGNTGVQWMGSGSDVSGNKATAAWLSNFISIDEHSDGTRTVKKVLRNEDTQVDLVTEETDETGEITDNANYFYSSSYYVNAGKEPDMYIDCVYVKDLRAYPTATGKMDGLAAGSTLSFAFSEAMNTSTLTADNVVFSDGVTEINAASVQCTDGINVVVTVPSGLAAATDYTLIFKKEITNAGGERLNNDKKFAVQTAAADFYATEITPANGASKVSVSTPVIITFNKNVDLSASNVTASLTDSKGAVKQLTVDTEKSYENKVYFKYEGLLSYSETYTLSVAGIVSESGSQMFGAVSSVFITDEDKGGYLVKLDFDDASDIEKLIPNSSNATSENFPMTVENGEMKFTRNLGNWTNVTYTFEGSEDWLDYEISAKAKRDTSYGFPGNENEVSFGVKARDSYGLTLNYSQSAGVQATANYDGGTDSPNIKNSKVSTNTANWHTLTVRADDKTDGSSEISMSAVDNSITGSAETTVYENTVAQTEPAYTSGKAILFSGGKKVPLIFDYIYVKDLRAHANAYPLSELKAGDTITIKFSETMKADTLVKDNISLSLGGTEVTDFTMTTNGTDEIYVTLPSTAEAGAEYVLTAKKEISALNGERMNSNKKFTVTTAQSKFNITGTTPAQNAENVGILEDITLTFDKDIDYTKISDAVLSLKDSKGNSIDCSVASSLSSSNMLYISIASSLAAGETYTFTISGVSSADGYTMAGTKTLTFKTEESKTEYLYYQDFENVTTLEEAGLTAVGAENAEKVAIENGQLVIQLQTAEDKDAYRPLVYINDSMTWSDYDITVDILSKVRPNNPRVYFRYNGSTTNSYSYSIGTNATNYADSTMTGSTLGSWYKFLTTTSFGAHSSAMTLNLNVQGNHGKATIVYLKSNSEIVENRVTHDNDLSDSNKYPTGGIAFGGYSKGTVAFDNIKVKDLGISFVTSSVKNIKEGGTIDVIFDRSMMTPTMISDNVIITDELGNTINGAGVTSVNSTTMRITAPTGLESGKLYTVTLKKDISSTDGIQLSCDKSFEFKSAEQEIHISNMNLYSEENEVYVEQTAVTAGKTVFGYAEVKNNGKTSKDATLVMAIYKNNVLERLEPMYVPIDAGTTKTLKTADFTFPENTEGYSVSVMLIDTLGNIKPLTKSVDIGK